MKLVTTIAIALLVFNSGVFCAENNALAETNQDTLQDTLDIYLFPKEIPEGDSFQMPPNILKAIELYTLAQTAYCLHIYKDTCMQKEDCGASSEEKTKDAFAVDMNELKKIYHLKANPYHKMISDFLTKELPKTFLDSTPEKPYEGYFVIRPTDKDFAISDHQCWWSNNTNSAGDWSLSQPDSDITMIITPLEYSKKTRYTFFISGTMTCFAKDLGRTIRIWNDIIFERPFATDLYNVNGGLWVSAERLAFLEISVLARQDETYNKFIGKCNRHTTYANPLIHEPYACNKHFVCDKLFIFQTIYGDKYDRTIKEHCPICSGERTIYPKRLEKSLVDIRQSLIMRGRLPIEADRSIPDEVDRRAISK